MITNILKGIDMCEVDHTDGWWETNSGATFGREKLIEAQGYEARLLQRITELEAQLADAQQAARWESDVASQAIADLEPYMKDAALGLAIMRACRELPLNFTLEINLERGAGDVALFDECATDVTPNLDDMEFAEKVNAAIDIAVQPKEQAK